ncbi:MAG: serine/threonine protein phosphatase [Lentisphaeraceae bacterium]|nr:serine/threonine protein phosphatase [Lentisphaeraceae bacterium]
MATYAIGDIHGNYTCLKALIDKISPDKNDTLIFLGDYIDRGMFSKQVIEEIIALQQVTNIVALKGNHEIMMLSSRNDDDCFNQWMGYGGFDTVASYESDFNFKNWANQIPDSHWDFLENTIPYFENEKYIFVHASIDANKDMKEQEDDFLYWKSFDTIQAHKSGKITICGHTSQKNGEINTKENAICIDTWSLMMWLTCLNVDNLEFIKANAQGDCITGKLTI